MKKNIKLLALIMLLLNVGANAQNGRINKAKQKNNDLAFAKSIDIYEDLLATGVDSSEIAIDVATSYYQVRDMEIAAEWYAIGVEGDASSEDVYRYAQSLKASGDYELAGEQLKRFHSMEADDSRAKRHLENEKYFEELSQESTQFELQLVNNNSTESDFSPAFYGNEIVFASARNEGVSVKRKYAWNNAAFLDLYIAKVTDTEGQLGNAIPFSSTLNSSMHEGPLTFTADQQTVYFTRNNFVKGKAKKSSDQVINLNIYVSNRIAEGWSSPKAFVHNNDEYSVGHPTLSEDGKTMYFASDMPGGYGEADIYMTTLDDDGNWSAPVNLGGEINTEGNELFPFIHADGTLYFSSEGQVGLGGLDVFESKNIKGLLSTPKNLGAPINSELDDFGFILNSEKNRGYLSSNRKGGKGDDDLYTFAMEEEIPLLIEGVIVNAADGSELEGSKVMLVNRAGEPIEEQTMGADGAFSFSLNKEDCEYKIMASNGEYWSTYNSDKTPCETLIGNIDLGEIPLEEMKWGAKGTIKDKKTGAPLEGFTITLSDLSTGENQSEVTSSNGFASFALEEGSNYEIRFEKPGYFAKSAVFTTVNMEPGIVEINKLTGLEMSFEAIEIGKEIKIENIYYDYDKSYIRTDAAIELDKILKVLQDNPSMKIEMGSHTDARGSDSYNLKLSKKRAKAAMEYLITKGIDASRLTWKGYGETSLVNDCGNGIKCSDAIHEENRRTTFKVLAL